MKTILITCATLGLLFSGESTVTYRMEGMMCARNCPQKVYDSLNDVDGIKSCRVDFESKTATIIFDDEKIDSNKISKTITKATYYKVIDLNKKDEPESFWNWLFGKS